MKRILTFIVGGVMMVLGAACSSDDEPNNGTENGEVEATLESPSDLDGRLDDGLLSELLAGSRNGTLLKDTTVIYYLPTGWDHWYEETEVCYGSAFMTPKKITFQDGVVYTSLSISFPNVRYAVFALLWSAYKISTEKNYDLYLRNQVDKDLLMRRINLNDTELYIHSFGGSDFVLSNTYEFFEGRYGEGGHKLEVTYYRMNDETLDFAGKALAFDSHRECVQFILDKCRERFGKEVDLNKIFTDRILDTHIYNFDELAEIYGLE